MQYHRVPDNAVLPGNVLKDRWILFSVTLENKKRLIPLALILALGAFFRVWGISSHPLWTDEIGTFWIASASTVTDAFHRAMETQGQSPFYYLLEWGVLHLLPAGRVSLRLISLCASVVSIFLVFKVCLVLFEWDGRWRKGSPYLAAITAAFFFACHTPRIYYAQEARPYALGMMFALLSQLYFLKLFLFSHWDEDERCMDWRKTICVVVPYSIFTALTIYCHYVLGSIWIAQNIVFMYWLFDDRIVYHTQTGVKWFVANGTVALMLLPLGFHLFPIVVNSGVWNWVAPVGVADTADIFLGSLVLPLVLTVMGLALLFHVVDGRLPGRNDLEDKPVPVLADRERRGVLFFIVIWLLVPPLADFVVSRSTNASLILPRYMTLSAPTFFLLVAFAVVHLRSVWLERILAILVCMSCLVLSPITTFKRTGYFAYFIPHDWKTAVEFVAGHSNPEDAVLIRFGVIKENWIPGGASNIIHDYANAPFHVFAGGKVLALDVYPLTYSIYPRFYAYYDKILKACEDKSRVWIIGVDPPNTNYPIGAVRRLFPRALYRMDFRHSFSGVFVCRLILRSDSAPPLANKVVATVAKGREAELH